MMQNITEPSAIDEEQLCRWLGAARPGDRLCYHRGFLAVDCDPTTSSLRGEDRAELRRLAQRALFAAETGLADLVQRRNGPGDFSYLIVARRRQKAARGSLRAILLASAAAQSPRHPSLASIAPCVVPESV
jgi:hypothetical protein